MPHRYFETRNRNECLFAVRSKRALSINQSTETECPTFVHLDADSGVVVRGGTPEKSFPFEPPGSPQPPMALTQTPSPPSILSRQAPWSLRMHPRLGSAPAPGLGMSIGGRSKTSTRALSADLRKRALKSRYASWGGVSVAVGGGGTGWMTTCLKCGKTSGGQRRPAAHASQSQL